MKGLKYLLPCLCFLACTNRKSVPPGIIQPDSMRVIMKDVILADQFAVQFLLKDSVRRDSVKKDSVIRRNVKLETLQLYETVFKLHNVTRETFRKSLAYYEGRPDQVKIIFDSLGAEQSRHRNDLYKPRTKPVVRQPDSLK